MKVSIVIAVFNEARTIRQLVNAVKEAPLGVAAEREIIVVDDGSWDGTKEILKDISGIKLLQHQTNQGKGASLKTGFSQVSGDFIIIQDADLEYDPRDYPGLLKPLLENRADVVFGSRFHSQEQRVLYFWHFVGNRLVTIFSNMFTNLNLTDVYVCYKVFRRQVLSAILPHLRSSRFAIEAEMTARIAHKGLRIYEVPVRYYGRTYEEGKKIGWKDAMVAMAAILYFNLLDRK